MGKKTWLPGKNLATFIASTFSIPLREQKDIVERISDAVSKTAPNIRRMMEKYPGFSNTGKRMLKTWSEGVNKLRDRPMYALPVWPSSEVFDGISDPPKLESLVTVLGKSELLAHRSKKPVKNNGRSKSRRNARI